MRKVLNGYWSIEGMIPVPKVLQEVNFPKTNRSYIVVVIFRI